MIRAWQVYQIFFPHRIPPWERRRLNWQKKMNAEVGELFRRGEISWQRYTEEMNRIEAVTLGRGPLR